MSPRIQRLRMRLLRFAFTVSHVPRKSLITADALSRAPAEQQDGQSSTEEEIDSYVQHVFASLPASNTQLKRVKEKQEDEVCQKLEQYYSASWPETETEYQMLLNPICKSRMNFRLSVDCFSKLNESSSQLLKTGDARPHSRGPSGRYEVQRKSETSVMVARS